MLDYESIQVGVDIGASKTVVVISQRDISMGNLLILGMGEAANISGIKRGKIVDLSSTIFSIQKAFEAAVLMAGIEFTYANVNIPGEVDSINSHGIVTIARKDREVKPKDVERVIEQAQILDIGNDRTILHLFPQYFSLDEQDFIKDPLGMTGLRLQGSVNMILAPNNNVSNAVKCFNRAGIQPLEGMFAGYASSNAVLTSEDKELGVLVLDIGAGSTDIMGFVNGYPVVASTSLIGGDSITRDLSIGLKLTEQSAEKLKCEYGCAFVELVDPVSEVEVAGIRKDEIKRISEQKIAQIIQPRVEEILMLAKKQLEKKDVELRKFSSVVLTGGVANLKGIVDICEMVFELPTRVGLPINIGGLTEKVEDPSFSTVIGLCLGEQKESAFGTLKKNGGSFGKQKDGQGFAGKVKGFFKDMLG